MQVPNFEVTIKVTLQEALSVINVLGDNAGYSLGAVIKKIDEQTMTQVKGYQEGAKAVAQQQEKADAAEPKQTAPETDTPSAPAGEVD